LKIQIHHGDITDLDSLKSATKNMDSVFHLAGLIAYSRAERAAMEKINVQGTANVIEACKANKIRRLVHMSSVVAIGASFRPSQVLTEMSPFNLHPYNLGYSETKRRAEELVKAASLHGNIDAVILNPSTVYGPGDAKKGSRKTQLKVARGNFKFYTPGGVSIISVEDFVPAVIAAWKKGRNGERYILAGENISIKQLFEMIAETAGVKPPKILLPRPVLLAIGRIGAAVEAMGRRTSFNSEAAMMAVLYNWYDSSKAQNELGLKVTPARISIQKSVNWMKEHNLI
jgi:dihydroflavonol-4-reductase